jgi:hypothetical protein
VKREEFVRENWIFDRMQAEVAYRTEELYRASGSPGYRGQVGNGDGRQRWWWKLRRRAAGVSVPEQRRPSHDQRPRVVGRAG